MRRSSYATGYRIEGDAKERQGPQIADEIAKLEQKAKLALIDMYNKLTPWQKTLSHATRSVRTASVS